MKRLPFSPIVFAAAWCAAQSGCAPAAELPKTQTFDSNGIKIAYFVQGEGEPVVLIHGWLSSAGINWLHRQRAVPRRDRGLAQKPQGHGRARLTFVVRTSPRRRDFAGLIRRLERLRPGSSTCSCETSPGGMVGNERYFSYGVVGSRHSRWRGKAERNDFQQHQYDQDDQQRPQ
jgi:hypothetical protein